MDREATQSERGQGEKWVGEKRVRGKQQILAGQETGAGRKKKKKADRTAERNKIKKKS